MTTSVAPAPPAAPVAAIAHRAHWTRSAGLLIVAGGVLLTAATAVEISTDVSSSPLAAAAFWSLFLASTLAHVAAMFPLALGRGDGRGAVGSSIVGKIALLGFGGFFLTNQSIYVLISYGIAAAEPGEAATAFLGVMSAVQGVLLLVGGIVIARAGVLRGAARGAILGLAIIGFALGVVVNVSSVAALIDVMYFVSTAAQIVAGVLIARASVAAAE